LLPSQDEREHGSESAQAHARAGSESLDDALDVIISEAEGAEALRETTPPPVTAQAAPAAIEDGAPAAAEAAPPETPAAPVREPAPVIEDAAPAEEPAVTAHDAAPAEEPAAMAHDAAPAEAAVATAHDAAPAGEPVPAAQAAAVAGEPAAVAEEVASALAALAAPPPEPEPEAAEPSRERPLEEEPSSPWSSVLAKEFAPAPSAPEETPTDDAQIESVEPDAAARALPPAVVAAIAALPPAEVTPAPDAGEAAFLQALALPPRISPPRDRTPPPLPVSALGATEDATVISESPFGFAQPPGPSATTLGPDRTVPELTLPAGATAAASASPGVPGRSASGAVQVVKEVAKKRVQLSVAQIGGLVAVALVGGGLLFNSLRDKPSRSAPPPAAAMAPAPDKAERARKDRPRGAERRAGSDLARSQEPTEAPGAKSAGTGDDGPGQATASAKAAAAEPAPVRRKAGRKPARPAEAKPLAAAPPAKAGPTAKAAPARKPAAKAWVDPFAN
jgi:hypothetical protein